MFVYFLVFSKFQRIYQTGNEPMLTDLLANSAHSLQCNTNIGSNYCLSHQRFEDVLKVED
jgi:hypothetical protein